MDALQDAPAADCIKPPAEDSVSAFNDAPPDFKYAGMIRRIAAAIVDIVLVDVVLYSFWHLIGNPLVLQFPALVQSDAIYTFLFCFFNVCLFWLYFATWESSRLRATPGKLLIGIEVCDLSGNQIGFARATLRHFAKFISMLGGLGIIVIDFTRQKQSLHDMMARCLVVKRTAPTS
jgi:uncharacterized RDD family membrane protein YckC